MLFVLVAIVGWAFQKPICFTLVVIGQLTQIPLRRAAPFGITNEAALTVSVVRLCAT